MQKNSLECLGKDTLKRVMAEGALPILVQDVPLLTNSALMHMDVDTPL